MDPIEIDITDLFAAAIKRAAERPRSASALLERKNQSLTHYARAIDNERECGCGGRDGVIVAVPVSDKPTIRGHLMITAFSHHMGGVQSTAFLTVEEAKHLVNMLGEAISAAERITGVAAAAVGGA